MCTLSLEFSPIRKQRGGINEIYRHQPLGWNFNIPMPALTITWRHRRTYDFFKSAFKCFLINVVPPPSQPIRRLTWAWVIFLAKLMEAYERPSSGSACVSQKTTSWLISHMWTHSKLTHSVISNITHAFLLHCLSASCCSQAASHYFFISSLRGCLQMITAIKCCIVWSYRVLTGFFTDLSHHRFQAPVLYEHSSRFNKITQSQLTYIQIKCCSSKIVN